MSKSEQPLKMIANKSTSIGGLASSLFTIGFCSIELHAAKSDKVNILIIAVDDLNDWIGVLNEHPNASTSNSDRLAKQGLKKCLPKVNKCLPKVNGPSDPTSKQGMDYNQYLHDLYKRTLRFSPDN